MLIRFKTTDLSGLDTADVAGALALTVSVQNIYKLHGAQPPAWVDSQASNLEAVFKARIRDELLAKREQVLRQLAGLQTPEERRKSAEAELEALNKLLGG